MHRTLIASALSAFAIFASFQPNALFACAAPEAESSFPTVGRRALKNGKWGTIRSISGDGRTAIVSWDNDDIV